MKFNSFVQGPSERGISLQRISLSGLKNLLPQQIDFHLVEPGTQPTGSAGISFLPGDALVSVSIQQDSSGGRFMVTKVDVYDIVQVDPSELPHPPKVPLFELVLASESDGSAPIAVSTGQAVGAVVKFIAPQEATGESFTAKLEFRGDLWTVPINLSIRARVAGSDLNITWGQANPFGILTNHKSLSDPFEGNWFAGHVNAILPILSASNNGSLLVGANTGGVWLVRTATPDLPASAMPLSDDWDDPNITCLAQGPADPEHFYAGASGHVYETNPHHDPSILSWRRITTQNYGGIFSIGIVPGSPPRIVLATSMGVFWAEIPSSEGVYTWKAVTTMVDNTPFPTGTYSGLAVSGSRVVVAAWGVDLGLHHYGVFYGDWSSGDLHMTRSSMPPRGSTDFTSVDQQMYRTSLATCSGNSKVLYAVSSTEFLTLGPLLRSGDGGQCWTLLNPTVGGSPLSKLAGAQGDYNNCIAVAPSDANTIAVGWQNGTFCSRDGGNTFVQFSDANLHADVHGLTFDPADTSGRILYIASDGGVAITKDGGKTFDSSANQRLANLEFYSTYVTRDFYGTLSLQGDLIAGGLQDNSNVVCQLTAPATFTPWAPIDGGCDGGVVAFIGTGQVLTDLVCSGNGTNLWVRSLHGHSLYDIDKGMEVPVRANNGPNALLSPILEAITLPVLKNGKGQLMYAVASPFNSLQIYGLFANSDGSDLHAELIGTVPAGPTQDSISALASLNGTTVLIGTSSGRALNLAPNLQGPVGALASTVAPDVPAGVMTRILSLSPTLAFANYNNQSRGLIIRYDGQSWVRSDHGLPGDACYGLTSRNTSIIFTATDDRVFSSYNQGQSWLNASTGLPRRPHCADLRVGTTPGGDVVYLSTFGRSLWTAGLP